MQLEAIATTTVQVDINRDLVKWRETNKPCLSVWGLKEDRRTLVQFRLGMAGNSPPEKILPFISSAPRALCGQL